MWLDFSHELLEVFRSQTGSAGDSGQHAGTDLASVAEGERLEAGDVGTVVHVYRDGLAYEVEFTTLDGCASARSQQAHVTSCQSKYPPAKPGALVCEPLKAA